MKDRLVLDAAENVEQLFREVSEDAARASLHVFCEWLNEEATVEELAAELLRGTTSTDITAAKDRIREVTRQVELALRRRIGWSM